MATATTRNTGNAYSPAFNNLQKDASRQPLQFGNMAQAIDASGTPKKSPLTVSNSVLTITIPANAIKMICYALTAAIRLSDESTCADHYYTLQTAQTSPTVIDVANQNVIYALRDGGSDGTLHFLFITV